MSRLIRYMKPYTLPFLVMVVFLLGQTLASLALPDLFLDPAQPAAPAVPTGR